MAGSHSAHFHLEPIVIDYPNDCNFAEAAGENGAVIGLLFKIQMNSPFFLQIDIRNAKCWSAAILAVGKNIFRIPYAKRPLVY